MLRKSFKLLSQKVFIPLLVLLFIATGCSNSTGSGGGSDSGGGKGSGDEGTQTVSASTVEKGIKVTVDVPEGCPYLYFNRIKKGSEYRECWYFVENAQAGAYTAIDYFVEEDTTYTYSVDFYDTNWKFKETSKSIEATSSEKGFDLPATTNKAKATYNSDTKKLSFSTKPTFSYTESPVDGYPTLKIELLYKCAENAYECICEYPLGGTQTGEIYDYIFERYKGKTITFFCIRYKFKSADGKSSYEFDIGHDAEIQDINLGGASGVSGDSGDEQSTVYKPIDLSKFVPTASSLAGKIITAGEGEYDEENGGKGHEYSIYKFADSVESSDSSKILCTKYRYMYQVNQGAYQAIENFNLNEHCDNRYYFKDGIISWTDNNKPGDKFYCINGNYYQFNDFAFPKISGNTNLIGSKFGLDYDIGEAEENIPVRSEFYFKNSSTVHIMMKMNGSVTADVDTTYTFNNGVCIIKLPESISADNHEELVTLFTGDELVVTNGQFELLDSLPVYPAPLITN